MMLRLLTLLGSIGCALSACIPLNGIAGNFTSPNYPDPYDPNIQTSWCIEGNQTCFFFKDFEVAPGDNLTIFNGNESQTIIGTFTGSQMFKVVFSGGANTTVIFASGNTADPPKGFHIFYSTERCDIEMDGMSRRSIKSPMYLTQNVSILASYRLKVPSDDYNVALSFDHAYLKMGQLLFYDDWENKSLIGNITATNGSTVKHIKDFISNSTFMSIDMVLDASVDQSFSATMDWVTKGCSFDHTITTKETVTSPHYPNSYPHHVRCRMLLHADHASALNVTFSDFAVADQYDQLMMVDGDSKYSQFRGLFTKTTPPSLEGFMLTQGSSVWMEFTTDVARSAKGFSIDIVPIAFGGAAYNAGRVTLGPAKNLETNDASVNDTDVYFQLFVDEGYQVYTTINGTNMYPTSVIEFHDGPNVNDPILASFVSDKPHFPLFSSASSMLVVAKGFIHNGTLTPQFLNLDFNMVYDHGMQHNSMGGNGQYEVSDATHATWLIHNTEQSGIVALTVNSLMMKNASLTVYNGLDLDRPIMHITEGGNSFPVFFTGMECRVEFLANEESEDMEFRGSYTIVSECGGEFVGMDGELQSPAFPNQYPYNARCEWHLTLPKDKYFHFTVPQLQLLPDHNVTVYSGNQTNPVAVYNGTVDAPQDLVLPATDTYTVVFSSQSDSIHVGQGFSAEYSSIDCGEMMIGMNASTLKTPGYPKPPSNATHCVWIIQLSQAKNKTQVVSLNITLKGYVNDSKTTTLEFRDGTSSMSPVIPLKLKDGQNDPILATSDYLWISYEYIPASSNEDPFTFLMNYSKYECNETCDQGKCLNPAWKCDRIMQCSDGADEANCSYNTPVKTGYAGWAIAVAVIVTFILTLVIIIVAPALYRRWSESRGYSELRDLMAPVPT